MQLKYKLLSALASGSLLASLLAPAALAADLEISGNGAGSTNKIKISESNDCTVQQTTNTIVVADVDASANTGGNKANSNTGGKVEIKTGDATANASVKVNGGSNAANDPCRCICQCNDCQETNHSAVIKDNGADSNNKIKVSKSQNSNTEQETNTLVFASVVASAKTGKNKANKNTGPGTTEIKTGKAEAKAKVKVTGGSNTLNP